MEQHKDFWQEFKELFAKYKVETIVIAVFVLVMSVSGIASIFIFLTMLIILFFVSEPFSSNLKELWNYFQRGNKK